MDADLTDMSRAQLVAEVARLRDGIRRHRDSIGQELCWHHPALWALLPETTDPVPVVPEWPEFIARLRAVSPVTRRASSARAEVVGAVPGLIRNGRARVGRRADEAAVLKLEREVRVARDPQVVRDGDDRRVLRARQPVQQREDHRAGLGVEVAGGLVGEDQPGPVRQRAPRSRTRCCSPPESLPGRRSCFPPSSPTCSSSAIARALRSRLPTPANSIGIITFSTASRFGIRL